MAGTAAAQATIATAPGEQLEVALLTYGPGEVYWERFGHDAIEVRDTASGEAVAFNYGVFDFNADDFLLNFIRGHMHYRIAAVPAARDVQFYRGEGRSVRRQVLALTPAQRTSLRDFLVWNMQPANRHYRYRYYRANCATKVRDAIDHALGGELQARLEKQSTDMTWRGQTRRLMAPQPALMLLLDLGLAGIADQPLDAWQASFLPGVLADQLMHVTTSDSGTPLLATDQLLAPSRLQAPPDQPPDLRLPLLLAGALLALLLWLGLYNRHRWVRRGAGILATAWLAAAGLAGLLMLGLWLLTAHEVAWANANLWLFNPLALALIPAIWRRRPRPWQHALAWALLLLAGFSLLANFTGLITQENLPWILLALPVWLVLARCLGRPRTY